MLNKLEQRDICEGLASCKLVMIDSEQRHDSEELATCSTWLSEQQSHRLREEEIAASFLFLMHFAMLNRLHLLMSLQRGWWQAFLCSFCSLQHPMRTCP